MALLHVFALSSLLVASIWRTEAATSRAQARLDPVIMHHKLRRSRTLKLWTHTRKRSSSIDMELLGDGKCRTDGGGTVRNIYLDAEFTNEECKQKCMEVDDCTAIHFETGGNKCSLYGMDASMTESNGLVGTMWGTSGPLGPVVQTSGDKHEGFECFVKVTTTTTAAPAATAEATAADTSEGGILTQAQQNLDDIESVGDLSDQQLHNAVAEEDMTRTFLIANGESLSVIKHLADSVAQMKLHVEELEASEELCQKQLADLKESDAESAEAAQEAASAPTVF